MEFYKTEQVAVKVVVFSILIVLKWETIFLVLNGMDTKFHCKNTPKSIIYWMCGTDWFGVE